MKTTIIRFTLLAALLAVTFPARAGFMLKELSPQSAACIACHKKESAAIYEQWGSSKHYRGNIGCFECHTANEKDPDAYEHYGQFIATIVSPKDDLDTETAWQRIHATGRELDRMESQPREFYEKVRQGYLALASAEPQRIVVVDAGRAPEMVHADILKLVEARRHAV